jgi:hypothetical protein
VNAVYFDLITVLFNALGLSFEPAEADFFEFELKHPKLSHAITKYLETKNTAYLSDIATHYHQIIQQVDWRARNEEKFKQITLSSLPEKNSAYALLNAFDCLLTDKAENHFKTLARKATTNCNVHPKFNAKTREITLSDKKYHLRLTFNCLRTSFN